jgi:hypothetical protein
MGRAGVNKSPIGPGLARRGGEPAIAHSKIARELIDDIGLRRPEGLHNLARPGGSGGRCGVIRQKTAHVRRRVGRGRFRAEKLCIDIEENFVWIGGWDHGRIVRRRPRCRRAAGEHLGIVQHVVIGIGRQAVKDRRGLRRDIELRRVILIVIEPAQQVVEGPVFHHDDNDVLDVLHALNIPDENLAGQLPDKPFHFQTKQRNGDSGRR